VRDAARYRWKEQGNDGTESSWPQELGRPLLDLPDDLGPPLAEPSNLLGPEPQLAAGIVSDLRIVNGQRGRVAIFRLDDGSAALEAVVGESLLEQVRHWLRDDEPVVVQVRVQPDRYGGGLRLNVQQIWDIAAARCRHARYLSVAVDGEALPVAEVLEEFPPRRVTEGDEERLQGLPLRLRLRRGGAVAEIDLGPAARFFPSDAALQRWARCSHGRAQLVYEAEAEASH